MWFIIEPESTCANQHVAVPGKIKEISVETYSVIVEGRSLEGFDSARVSLQLARLMKITPEVAASLLVGQEIRVKSGVDSATGERYLAALSGIGVACRLDPENLDFAAEVSSRENLRSTPSFAPVTSPPLDADPVGGSAVAAEANNSSSQKTIWRIFSSFLSLALFVVAIYFFGKAVLGFVNPGGSTALGDLLSNDSQAKLIADQIIKGDLKSPASYKAARQDVLWFKSLANETAYIVRTEYDSQNGFGALLRDCQYISFVKQGDQFAFNRLNGIQPCADDRDKPDWEDQKRQLVPILIKNANLERFSDIAQSTSATALKAPSPPPVPASTVKALPTLPPKDSLSSAKNVALGYARSVAAKADCTLHEDDLVALSGTLSDVNGEVIVTTFLLEGCGGGNYWGLELAVLQFREGEAKKIAGTSGPGFENLSIVNGRIVASVTSYGPNDARCCPSVKGNVTFSLRGEELLPANQTVPPVQVAVPPNADSSLISLPGSASSRNVASAEAKGPNLATEMLPLYRTSPNWRTCSRLNEFHVSDSGNAMTAQAWAKCINGNSERANQASLQLLCDMTALNKPKVCMN